MKAPQTGPDLTDQDLRLLERREVPAPIGFAVVNQVGVCAFDSESVHGIPLFGRHLPADILGIPEARADALAGRR